MIRGAACRVVQCIALSDLPMKPKTAATLLASLHENLKHPNEDIQKAAVAGLSAFLDKYFPVSFESPEAGINATAHFYVQSLKDPNAAVRRGFGLALGVLPPALLKACSAETLTLISDTLRTSIEVEAKVDDRDAEARRNAVQGAQGFVVQCLSIHTDLVTGTSQFNIFVCLPDILQWFLEHGACDYSLDNRGDVGSWVREASLLAVGEVLKTMHRLRHNVQHPVHESFISGMDALLTQETATAIVSHLLRQMGERIDRVRDVAGNVLHALALSAPPAANAEELPIVLQMAPHQVQLRTWFEDAAKVTDKKITDAVNAAEAAAAITLGAGPAVGASAAAAAMGGQRKQETAPAAAPAGPVSITSTMGWSAASETFPSLMKCLSLEKYRMKVLEGLAGSIGGMTESLMRHGTDGIVFFFNKDPATTLEAKEGVVRDLCALCVIHKADHRFIIPFLKTFASLENNSCLRKLSATSQADAADSMLEVCKVEMKKADIGKCFSIVNVLCALLSLKGPVESKNRRISTCLQLLAHKYPKVRKALAEQLYISLMSHGDAVMPESEETQDAILATLADSDWLGDLASAKALRLPLYSMFGIEPPAATAASGSSTSANNTGSTGQESQAPKKPEEETYGELVKTMGY